MSPPPTVELRALTPSDLDALFEHQRDPVAVALVGFATRERPAFDAHWARLLADPEVLARAILAEGRLVGHVSTFERAGVREVGYWLDRRDWGRGIATAALTAFLPLEPRRPLHACVAAHNLPSTRVLQKCGFTLLREDDATRWLGLGEHSAHGVRGGPTPASGVR